MNDTLFHGERVVISSLFYEPQYGDIVVISRNYYNKTAVTGQSASPIIKRVIATAGQNVYIDFNAGNVYVFDDDSLLDELRGKTFDDSLKEKMKKYMLDEPYTRTPTNNSGNVTFPAKVPDNCVFVLGDNRNDSRDSRFSDIGMVDKRYIMGKAIMRVFPFEKFGKIG